MLRVTSLKPFPIVTLLYSSQVGETLSVVGLSPTGRVEHSGHSGSTSFSRLNLDCFTLQGMGPVDNGYCLCASHTRSL